MLRCHEQIESSLGLNKLRTVNTSRPLNITCSQRIIIRVTKCETNCHEKQKKNINQVLRSELIRELILAVVY